MADQVVQVLLLGNADRLKSAFGEASDAATKSSATMTEKIAGIGKAATFALAGAAVVIGGFAIKQAMEQEEATARLKTAIRNAGDSWGEYADAVQKADDKAISLGFDDAELEASLAKLTTATKDTGKSIGLMSLAEDIARGRKISLSSATDLLAKVETGHVALLGRLGIATKDAAGNTISQEEAVRRLTDLYGGQASAYAGTFAGKIQVLKQTVSELAENIGFALIPVIETLATGMSDVINFFEKHKEVAIALGVVIGGPLVAAMATYIATQTMAVATKIADFWTGAAAAAASLTGATTTVDAALIAETASLMVAQGATLAETEALLGMTEASVAAEAGMSGMGLLAGGALLGGMFALAYAVGVFDDGLNQLGVTVDDVKTKSVGQLATELETLKSNFHHALDSTLEYTSAASMGGIADKQAALDKQAVAKAQENFNDVLDKAPQFAQKFIDAAQQAGFKTADWKAELAKHVDATRAAQSAQELYNQNIDGGTTAINDQNIALQTHIDLLNKSANAQIGAARADLATKDSLDSLYTATIAAVAAGGQDAAANEELTKKTLDAEDAILRQVDAHIKGGESAHQQIGGLEALAATLAPSSPLKVWLDQYIASLKDPAANSVHAAGIYLAGTTEAQAALDALHYTLQVITGQPWQAVVQVTSEIDNQFGFNR